MCRASQGQWLFQNAFIMAQNQYLYLYTDNGILFIPISILLVQFWCCNEWIFEGNKTYSYHAEMMHEPANKCIYTIYVHYKWPHSVFTVKRLENWDHPFCLITHSYALCMLLVWIYYIYYQYLDAFTITTIQKCATPLGVCMLTILLYVHNWSYL